MQIHVVTSKAQEEARDGTILSVKVRFHGAFTDESRAEWMAAKYDGSVSSFYVDKENVGTILQYWENPGYASG